MQCKQQECSFSLFPILTVNTRTPDSFKDIPFSILVYFFSLQVLAIFIELCKEKKLRNFPQSKIHIPPPFVLDLQEH